MLSRFLVLLVSILVSIVLAVGANDTMTKNLKVLVSSSDFPESGLKVLKEHFTVLQTKYRNFGEEGLNQTKEDLLKLIPGVSALVWVSYHPITKELLDKAGPQLKLVATVSAGYNHCNLDELRARGIKLANTPNVLSSAVAEIAVSLMLGAARRFTENLDQVRSGNWEIGFDAVLGQDLRGSTVGIIGFGGIGHATARRLAGFEVAKFLYSGHREKPEAKELGAEFVSQDELLRQSDFILLAVPLTNDTKLMINKDTLAMMKSNAILVNVGRGDLVDQDALYDALKSRQIYAAGLDVTTPEPLPKDHKLLTLPNIFILPHIGSATVRTRSDMAVLAANNVVNALTGKPLLTPVQFGEWKPGVQWLLGQDVTSSTIGVVGFGGLGQAIARRLRGFDIARLLSSGRTHKPEAKTLEAERVLLEQLLKESDFVILCCPLTDETKHLINADSLKIMKKTAVLVNVARGDVIDHDALVTALKENTIFSAALVDVTTPEPLPKDHPLVSLPNCYVIDHDALVTALKENTIFSAALVDVTTPEPLPKDHPLVSLPNCCKFFSFYIFIAINFSSKVILLEI